MFRGPSLFNIKILSNLSLHETHRLLRPCKPKQIFMEYKDIVSSDPTFIEWEVWSRTVPLNLCLLQEMPWILYSRPRKYQYNEDDLSSS